MGAVLSRFRVIDLDPPSNLDWVDRAKAILEAEGLPRQELTLSRCCRAFKAAHVIDRST